MEPLSALGKEFSFLKLLAAKYKDCSVDVFNRENVSRAPPLTLI